MARHAIRLNTISSRFTLIVSVAVIGCMFLIQMAFYSILRTTLEDHGRSTMQVANESIEMTLENNYNSLLQISQLMDTSGMIGHEFIQFMQAESYMQKHDTMLSVDELLTTATFSAGSNLAIYYDTVLDLNYLSGYQPVKTSFRPAQLPAIQQTGLLIFHAVHASQSRFSNIPVVSLLRGTPSSASKDLAVYIEKPVDLDMLVDEYRKSYGYDLIFLQLDDSGTVLYSSSDTVPAGTQIRLTPGESIHIQQYLYHDFTVEPGTGPVLLGEVSQCNDDNTDNRFNPPVGRFPEIEEDEPPYRLLCNEYPEAE